MTAFLDTPLTARNGHTLEVILTSRVSDPGPGKQDLRSLDDQEAQLRTWLKDHTDLPVQVTVVAGSGSGELLDRQEYLKLIELVESDKYDLVLAEDLGRIIRRIHAHLFCEMCVDHDTRLISLNDPVDTAKDGWQDASIFSAWHHERSNRDTSGRIKRTHRNRFDHGGCAAFPIFGIIKPSGAKSDEDWSKDPYAEEVYRDWFCMLDEGALYSEIADWLNENKVPTGPYHRNKKWDGRMVAQTSHNILLKGYRYRNKRKTKRNSNGKYVSIKADSHELRLRHVPHLAFFEEKYYDRVIAKVDARNGKYRRKSDNGKPARRRGSNKPSRWPGKHLVCGLCRHKFVWGGHGQTDRLMCDGCRNYHCWQAISVDGPLAASKITEAVFEAIESLPGFDPCLHEMLREEITQKNDANTRRLREIERQLQKTDREIENVMEFIRSGSKSAAVREEIVSFCCGKFGQHFRLFEIA